MTSIDDQVAAFARELDGLAAYDGEQTAVDIGTLTAPLMTAASHELAAVALREFVDEHPGARQYASAVAIAALSAFGLQVMLAAPIDELPGDGGMLRRIQRLAYAARGLGLAVFAGGAL